jgi:hypothetical protein
MIVKTKNLIVSSQSRVRLLFVALLAWRRVFFLSLSLSQRLRVSRLVGYVRVLRWYYLTVQRRPCSVRYARISRSLQFGFPPLSCVYETCKTGQKIVLFGGRKLAVMSVDHSFDDDYTFHIPSPGGFRFVSTVASTDAADASHPNWSQCA